MQFVFSGKNYIGPVKEATQFGQHRRGPLFHSRRQVIRRRRFLSLVLDLGTGSGSW